jgi:hypothetical protein
MGSNGRFADQQVVNSFNLFIDGDRSSIIGDTSSRGDDVKINLEGSSIIANDGEMIRMTLTNFEMFNNLYHVDENNSRFQTRCDTLSAPPTQVLRDLTRQNYSSVGDIAIDFANIIGNVIKEKTAANNRVLVLDIENVVVPGFIPYDVQTQLNYNLPTPDASGNIVTGFTATTTKVKPTSLSLANTSNRLLDITYQIIDGSGATPTLKPIAHGINALHIQCLSSQGDAYCLLGALRQDTTSDISFNSFKVNLDTNYHLTDGSGNYQDVLNTATRIRVRGYFPMQRMTDPYVYLRCKSQQSGGLEMTVLADSLLASNTSDITSSDILAKLKRDVEFITFDGNGSGNEYFVNLQQKKISSLQLYLTDSKNRQLGRSRTDGSGNNTGGGTAAGYDNIQDSLLEKNRLNLTGKGYTNNSGFASQLQSSLGNLFYTAVVRIDIIKMSNPARLETPALPLPLPARKAQNGVLTFQDYGMPKYGV